MSSIPRDACPHAQRARGTAAFAPGGSAAHSVSDCACVPPTDTSGCIAGSVAKCTGAGGAGVCGGIRSGARAHRIFSLRHPAQAAQQVGAGGVVIHSGYCWFHTLTSLRSAAEH